MRSALPSLSFLLLFLLFGVISDVTARPSDDVEVLAAEEEKRAAAAAPAATASPSQVAHLDAQIAKLSAKVALLSAEVEALQSEASQRRRQLHDVGQMNHDLASPLGKLNSDVRAFIKNVTNLDSYVKAKVQNLENHLRKVEYGVGFTVMFRTEKLGPSQIETHNHDQILRFDDVWQRGGQNYNATTGLFTAPSSGTYAFFLTVQRNHTAHDDCLEVIVGRTKNLAITTVIACSPYTSSFGMGFMYLRSGQTVQAQTRYSDLIEGGLHTGLSGFKISS